MGVCETKNNCAESNKPKEISVPKDNFNKINEPMKLIQTNLKSIRIQEGKVSQIPLEKVDRSTFNVSESICRVKIKTENERIEATGFLLAFWIDLERFYCFVTNEHIIKKELLNNNINIYISNDSKILTYINLNNNKRYMKSFTDIGLDITVVEILDEDNISKDYYLYPELEEYINNNLINNSIYIPQYPGGKELMNARGIIKEINKYEFTHLANTEQGASGSPIFLENSINVIGIHKEGNLYKRKLW